MSLSSVLGVARSAMKAQQVIMQTAGHNIANVETEGYSRQRVETAPLPEQHWTYGSVGTGIGIRDVRRARDELLDVSYRAEASGAQASQLRHDMLASVEGILGEPSDTGLAAAMDAFWSSWSDLATQPTSAAARSVVQQRGQNVASILQSFDRRLTDLRAQTTTQLDNAVAKVNTLADHIASLNGRIVSTEVDGTTASDLRDQRDLALDELAKLGEVRVLESADGSAQVLLGNNGLVDGVRARNVRTVTAADGRVALHLANGAEPLLPVGGAMQAMVDFLNVDLPDTTGRLDAIAASLVSRVNALHATGTLYPTSGAPVAAGAFFDPTMTTARDIRLSTDVAASASNVAASATTPTGANVAGPGNNEVALAMANLRDALGQVTYTNPSGGVETDSFANFYRDTTSRIGTQVTNAATDAQVHATLATQADTRRKSVSGVNLDEELTTLMRAQQAYAAAAKVVSVASEMMETLTTMV
jgi:flagellar hook-associated protein 1 FlgK